MNQDHHAVNESIDTSRRTVLKGAAWSVPVMAVAASVPLAAATGLRCGPVDRVLGEGSMVFTPAGDNVTGTGTLQKDGETVGTFTVTSMFGTAVQHTTGTGANASWSPNVWGVRENLIPVAGSGTSSRDYNADYEEALVFTFDGPVTDLDFFIYDVTWEAGYKEYVSVLADFVPVTPSSVGSALGQDATSGYYTPNAQTGNLHGAAESIAVRYTLPGPVTRLVVRMSRPCNPNDGGGVTVGFNSLTPTQEGC